MRVAGMKATLISLLFILSFYTVCLVLAQEKTQTKTKTKTVAKNFKCNIGTGFCERSDEVGSTTKSKCDITCAGTIWPSPLAVNLAQETFSFCDVQWDLSVERGNCGLDS